MEKVTNTAVFRVLVLELVLTPPPPDNRYFYLPIKYHGYSSV